MYKYAVVDKNTKDVVQILETTIKYPEESDKHIFIEIDNLESLNHEDYIYENGKVIYQPKSKSTHIFADKLFNIVSVAERNICFSISLTVSYDNELVFSDIEKLMNDDTNLYIDTITNDNKIKYSILITNLVAYTYLKNLKRDDIELIVTKIRELYGGLIDENF